MSYIEELFNLQNKVAVVIGGGGVLGSAMAEGLGRAGARLAILDVTEDHAKNKAAQFVSLGIEAIALQVDAAKKIDLLRAEQEIIKNFGQVDILINAPGINSPTPYFDISEEEWEKIIQVNLKSMFLACQVFGKRMIDRAQAASIINISSASSGPPLSKVFTYSISKAGVNNLTQFLAREWAPYRVRVNALAPGFFPAEQNRKVLTPERAADIMRHTPMNRFGEANELVGAVLWLSSEKASSFVTGAIIRVDGGFTAMTI